MLDTAFTTLDRDADGRAWASLDVPGGDTGASLWADAGFGYLMVYTGDTLGELHRRRRAVAIEPMTCPPNALRTGKDLRTSSPARAGRPAGGSCPDDGRVTADGPCP